MISIPISKCFARNTLGRVLSTTTSQSTKADKPLSGLQKEVISLYRRLLRVSHKKDLTTAECKDSSFIIALNKSSTSSHAMKEKFRKQAAAVSRRDHARIEHHIRQGEKYIKMMQMGGVKGIRVQ